jgi:membrane-associated PAP2 superfamily phosphatase
MPQQASRFAMSAKSSLVAISLVAVAMGAVFSLDAGLDLRFAALFYDMEHRVWPYDNNPSLQLLRDFNTDLIVVVCSLCVAALAARLFRWKISSLLPPAVAVFLLSTLILGPGLLANLILKRHWGRPRPDDVREFGGALDFVPWWNPLGTCDNNCSFVSGEASSAFWLLALAVLVPRPYRPYAVAGAIVYGFAVGLTRMAMGRHFISDILFAGIFDALVIWAMYRLIFRWSK